MWDLTIHPDIEWCASEDAEPRRGVDIEQCISEDTGLEEGEDCEIPHWLERETTHSLQGCGNLSLADTF